MANLCVGHNFRIIIAMRYIILVAVFFAALFCYEYGLARSWDDLDAGEHKIYGREKEEKYPVKTFFVEKEDWENHYSFMFFWLYKYTDYPKYKSMRVLPFYYGLDSKIDNRSMTLLPLLLSYFETDRDQKKSYILFPLYYSSISDNASDRSLLLLIWWGKEQYNYIADSYQTIFSCGNNYAFFCANSPCSVFERLFDVILRQIRILFKQFIYSNTLADLREYHADRDASSFNTGFTAHNINIMADSCKLLHNVPFHISAFRNKFTSPR